MEAQGRLCSGAPAGRLVQLRLDETRLPMPFEQIHCSDLRHWHGDCTKADWTQSLVPAADAIALESPPLGGARRPHRPAELLAKIGHDA